MPRILGRLWRGGGRRVEIADPGAAEAGPDGAAEPETEAPPEGPPESYVAPHPAQSDPGELGRRLEAARARLRETIPPPDDDTSGV